MPEPIVAAHRGASRLAPENTTAAFVTAMDRGAAALELDVQVTSDGALVVIHDPQVDRTTDGTGAVRSKNAAEIAELDAGSWFSGDFTGTRVPTLDDVLDLTDGRARLNIELKSRVVDRVAGGVVEAVFRHRAADRVIIMSFDLDSVLAAKRHLADPRRQDETALPIVMPIVPEPIPDALAFVQATGMDGLNHPPQYWDQDLITRFRDRGLAVHGGLINDARIMRDFFARGGQFADTDVPELFGKA